MGETLKERLDRLSKAATQGDWAASHRKGPDGMYRTQVFPVDDPDNTIATLHWHSVPTDTGYRTDRQHNAEMIAATVNAYRSGDLIPRDEITPQIKSAILDAQLRAFERGRIDAPYEIDIAALTAIKESKDD